MRAILWSMFRLLVVIVKEIRYMNYLMSRREKESREFLTKELNELESMLWKLE